MGDHEEPSAEDVERFGSAIRVCPDCKAEVYDEAEICHNCGQAFGSGHDGGNLPAWAIAAAVSLVVIFALGIVFI